MSFLAKLSKKEKIGLVLGVCFALLAFFDRIFFNPLINMVDGLNREIKINEKALSKDLRNISQKDIISQEYQKSLKYFKRFGSDEEEVARILGEIESLARRSAIYLVDTKPQVPVQVDFYKRYSVKIEATGDMESIVNFLYQLNTSSQLLRAEKLTLAIKQAGSPVIELSLLITKILFP